VTHNSREDHFVYYIGDVGDHQATFGLDISFEQWDDKERKKYPIFIEVTQKFRTVDESGRPAETDSDAIDSIERELIESIEEKCRGLFVGGMICDGTKYWFFYGQSTDGTDLVARKCISSLKVLPPFEQPNQRVKQDPKWEVYQSLLPTAEQIIMSQDMMVVDTLADAGDDHSKPREFDHLALFPDQDSAEGFVLWLKKNGYEKIAISPADHDGDDDDDQDDAQGDHSPTASHEDEYEDEDEGDSDEHVHDMSDLLMVKFTNTAPVVIDEIIERSMALNAAAIAHEGGYDGWECAVVKSK